MNERSTYTHFTRWWNEPPDWPTKWFDGRLVPQLTTKYGNLNKTLNKKVKKVLVKNPKSLVPPLDEDSGEEDTFISMLGRFFRRYFMPK